MSQSKQEPSRRERRKREVHERILAAAVELFDTRGVADSLHDLGAVLALHSGASKLTKSSFTIIGQSQFGRELA